MNDITLTSEVTVQLVQNTGGDHMVVAAARVSTSGEAAADLGRAACAVHFPGMPEYDTCPRCQPFKDRQQENAKLITYLMKHRHGTPFEHSSLTFFVHAPIFVWREWHRHRIGFCLAGDTEIWTESHAQNCGRTIRKRRIRDMWEVWNNGVKDSLGRVRFLPSVRNQKLRVLNEDTGFFQLGGISDIVQSGMKECLLVETEHKKGHAIRCSADHPILTSEGWVKAGQLTGSEWVAVVGKRSAFEHRQVPPALRAGIGVWTSMQRSALIPKDTACYLCGKEFHRDNLTLDHVVPVVENLKLALDVDNLKPACISCHRAKSDKEQALANRCNLAGVKFTRLRRKPYRVSEEMTYDISMSGPHHNFVANGIVVHNSYNEESARYKTLEPVFYAAPLDRPSRKVAGWKPGRPKFEADPALTARVNGRNIEVYRAAYAAYLENLADGADPGFARDCLPVGIYSACWVTCNPRSLMAFLSLRTHQPDAAFVSYPLYEIGVAARAVEQVFAKGWPLTYAAFCECGRVPP